MRMARIFSHWRPWGLLLAISGTALAWVLPRADSVELPASRGTAASVGDLIRIALEGTGIEAVSARTELRRLGQPAVDALMNRPDLTANARVQSLLDEVAQQQDARFSGLYWHTDLDSAIRTARREKKPILSLRLLGRLTEELSCANSRFFRTTLYPHKDVQARLRDEFVLHWESVRAVPVITIDFGNGRSLKRTITGNSLHLVLDENGRTVDVLPGLYTAREFSRVLGQAGPVAASLGTLSEAEFFSRRAEWHTAALDATWVRWRTVCDQAGLPPDLKPGMDHPADVWTRFAVAASPGVLEGVAQAAVAERAPPAEAAGRIAMTKALSETPMMRLVRNLNRILGEDSVRNEYYLHAEIHRWLTGSRAVLTGDQLVPLVYAELFLSPLDDPWYGLSRPDVYSALKNDGRVHDTIPQNSGD